MSFSDDSIALPHLAGIAATLIDTVQAAGLPDLCFAGPVAGAEYAVDLTDCEGMAFTRLATVFPSATFPNPDARPLAYFVPAVQVEVGIWRPIPVPDGGEPLTAPEQYQVVQLQLADMRAILDAICAYCDANQLPVVFGNYAPQGPTGGAVGGSWTATIGQPKDE